MIMVSDNLVSIMDVLRLTKECGELQDTHLVNNETFGQLGIAYHERSSIVITRTQRIDLAKKAIQLGANIAEIVELLTWKDFEGFVASVLIENSYDCVESYRRRGNSLIQGMEIDVIGVRGGTIIAIDAKMWGIRNNKASALKRAAEKQKDRTKKLSEDLDSLSRKIGKMTSREYNIFPAIVTWLVEEVELHEGVPVVPIFKLNSFILDFDQYEDLIVSYSGQNQSSSN
jgi:hypothetical protein